jgi:hypothetical protein
VPETMSGNNTIVRSPQKNKNQWQEPEREKNPFFGFNFNDPEKQAGQDNTQDNDKSYFDCF